MSTQYGYRRRDRDSERRAIAPRRRRLAPELMALEDRRLPAMMIHVTSVADSGPGTLRAAVEAADAATGPVKIDFQLPADSTITLTSGQLELSNVAEPVAIDGPGDGLLTISGGGESRVFQVDPGVTASISGMTVTDGVVGGYSGSGGDVSNLATLTLTGVTLSEGTAVRGAALFNSGSVTLRECTVTGNHDAFYGAMENRGESASMSLIGCDVSGNGSLQVASNTEAISNFSGTLSIVGSTIRGNGYGVTVNSYISGDVDLFDTTIAGNGGVGLAAGGGSLNLTNSSITGNGANGLFLDHENATIDGTTISDNYNMQVGAVVAFSSDLSMTDCTINGNQCRFTTGGLNIDANSKVTLSRCAIVGNSGPFGGFYTGGQTTLDDCTISGNSATTDFYQPSGQGGGIFAYQGTPWSDLTLNDCTISGNSASRNGGGLYVEPYSGYTPRITLNDTIIAGNTAAANPGDIAGQAASGVTGSNNLIGPGGSGGLTAAGHNLLNVANPGLAPLGDYGGPTETIALQPDSPALHAGVAVPGVTTDQRGFPLDSPPDIGAFQSQPGPLVVDAAIDGLGSGLGQLSLRQAVNLADVLDGGDAITFDQAAFAGEQTITLTGGPLELSNATGPVSIAGTTAALLTVSGGGTSRVFQVDPGVTATLSNLTVAGGSASGDGGGVLNAGTLTLANVVVAGDVATGSGGGVANSGILFASNTTISGDLAADGGGLANSGTAVILGSSIDGDSATSDGGGVFNSGFLSLGKSDLSANSAGLDGGGLFDVGTATLFFCTVDSNSAASGGGIFVDPSATTPAVLVGTRVVKNKGGNIVGDVIRR